MGPVWASWSVLCWEGKAATEEESGEGSGGGSGGAPGEAAQQGSNCPCSLYWRFLRASVSLALALPLHSSTQNTARKLQHLKKFSLTLHFLYIAEAFV